MKRSPWVPVFGLLYIAAIGMLGGLRSDHVLLGLLGLLDLYNERTRAFLRQFFPFIATGAIYDSMRYFYWQAIAGRVHVAEPWLLERAWFGIGGLTPNEWFLRHHWPVLDLACGFAIGTSTVYNNGTGIRVQGAGSTASNNLAYANVTGIYGYYTFNPTQPLVLSNNVAHDNEIATDPVKAAFAKVKGGGGGAAEPSGGVAPSGGSFSCGSTD